MLTRHKAYDGDSYSRNLLRGTYIRWRCHWSSSMTLIMDTEFERYEDGPSTNVDKSDLDPSIWEMTSIDGLDTDRYEVTLERFWTSDEGDPNDPNAPFWKVDFILSVAEKDDGGGGGDTGGGSKRLDVQWETGSSGIPSDAEFKIGYYYADSRTSYITEREECSMDVEEKGVREREITDESNWTLDKFRSDSSLSLSDFSIRKVRDESKRGYAKATVVIDCENTEPDVKLTKAAYKHETINDVYDLPSNIEFYFYPTSCMLRLPPYERREVDFDGVNESYTTITNPSNWTCYNDDYEISGVSFNDNTDSYDLTIKLKDKEKVPDITHDTVQFDSLFLKKQADGILNYDQEWIDKYTPGASLALQFDNPKETHISGNTIYASPYKVLYDCYEILLGENPNYAGNTDVTDGYYGKETYTYTDTQEGKTITEIIYYVKQNMLNVKFKLLFNNYYAQVARYGVIKTVQIISKGKYSATITFDNLFADGGLSFNNAVTISVKTEDTYEDVINEFKNLSNWTVSKVVLKNGQDCSAYCYLSSTKYDESDNEIVFRLYDLGLFGTITATVNKEGAIGFPSSIQATYNPTGLHFPLLHSGSGKFDEMDFSDGRVNVSEFIKTYNWSVDCKGTSNDLIANKVYKLTGIEQAETPTYDTPKYNLVIELGEPEAHITNVSYENVYDIWADNFETNYQTAYVSFDYLNIFEKSNGELNMSLTFESQYGFIKDVTVTEFNHSSDDGMYKITYRFKNDFNYKNPYGNMSDTFIVKLFDENGKLLDSTQVNYTFKEAPVFVFNLEGEMIMEEKTAEEPYRDYACIIQSRGFSHYIKLEDVVTEIVVKNLQTSQSKNKVMSFNQIKFVSGFNGYTIFLYKKLDYDVICKKYEVLISTSWKSPKTNIKYELCDGRLTTKELPKMPEFVNVVDLPRPDVTTNNMSFKQSCNSISSAFLTEYEAIVSFKSPLNQKYNTTIDCLSCSDKTTHEYKDIPMDCLINEGEVNYGLLLNWTIENDNLYKYNGDKTGELNFFKNYIKSSYIVDFSLEIVKIDITDFKSGIFNVTIDAKTPISKSCTYNVKLVERETSTELLNEDYKFVPFKVNNSFSFDVSKLMIRKNYDFIVTAKVSHGYSINIPVTDNQSEIKTETISVEPKIEINDLSFVFDLDTLAYILSGEAVFYFHGYNGLVGRIIIEDNKSRTIYSKDLGNVILPSYTYTCNKSVNESISIFEDFKNFNFDNNCKVSLVYEFDAES